MSGSGSGDVPPERLYEVYSYICCLNRSLLGRRSTVFRVILALSNSWSLVNY
ncbi:MAG: hypothetical protein HC785_02550 [Calothrix sp. CSU_2_0]|nr:hypothetical protein [Calothrix sp. CSU_2_0]